MKYEVLEGTARYEGLLLAPAEGFGLRPRHFWPSANSFLGLRPRPWPWRMYGEFFKSSSKRHLKIPKILKVQEIPNGPGFSTNVTQDKLGF